MLWIHLVGPFCTLTNWLCSRTPQAASEPAPGLGSLLLTTAQPRADTLRHLLVASTKFFNQPIARSLRRFTTSGHHNPNIAVGVLRRPLFAGGGRGGMGGGGNQQSVLILFFIYKSPPLFTEIIP